MILRLALALLLALPAAANLAPAASWADAKGFFSNERVKEEEIQPGVTWISASGKRQGQPLRTHVIAIDLSRRDLALQTLLGERFISASTGQFVRRSTVSQLQADNDALAAINVAFFDIGGTQAFQGLVLRDGVILREPHPHRPSLLYHPDGRAAIADLDWKGQVRFGEQRRPLAGVNRPELGRNEVVLYLSPWARSPGKEASFAEGRALTEILLEKQSFEPAAATSDRSRLIGRVLEVREGRESAEIGPDQFVLSAGPGAASFFRRLNAGDEVEVNWQLTNAPANMKWHELREVVSAQPHLIRNGRKETGQGAFWEGRHPRSAVGISRDGRRLLLVVVDGRSERSAGMSLNELIEYLNHLGAHDALNLDGGGSSALAAQIGGKDRLLNNPSDARERLVPNGLGVVVRAGAEDLKRPRTWTGANGRRMKGLFHSFNAEEKKVTLILDGRRYILPLSSLSEPDQALIRAAHEKN